MLDSLLQTLAIGLAQGATYALIALGYTMVYGVLGMINFAHGEVFMLGAYAGILAMAGGTAAGLTTAHPLAVFCAGAAVAVAVCTTHGLAIERVAYRPLRRAHLLAPLISAIGVSIFLQNYVQLAQGSDNKTFPHPIRTAFEGLVGTGGVISPLQVMILGIAVLCMVGLHLFVTRTKAGTAIRAVSQDPVMASLVGIHVDRAIAGTFALGSALAAVAGVLVALNYGNAQPYMGYVAGMKAFTAAVLGGIGSLPGAMLGGILMGVFEAFAASAQALGAGLGIRPEFLPGPEWKDGFAFLLLLGVLLLRPSGLMGEKSIIKV